GAGGVQTQRGPGQVQVVGEAVGQEGHACSGGGEHPRPSARGEVHGGLIDGGRPHVHTGVCAGQGSRGEGGVGEGFVAHFQQPALLGVHLCGFVGGDAEEGVVEVVVDDPGCEGLGRYLVRV